MTDYSKSHWELIKKARKAITDMELAAMATFPDEPDLMTVQSMATVASEAIGAFVVGVEIDMRGDGNATRQIAG